jgi:hypothetical protein
MKRSTKALSGAESVDTATTQLGKPSRTKNLIMEFKDSAEERDILGGDCEVMDEVHTRPFTRSCQCV